jgi:hypothetical protein
VGGRWGGVRCGFAQRRQGNRNHNHVNVTCEQEYVEYVYRDADKSLARPGRKQAKATEDFDVHIYTFFKLYWEEEY